MCRLRGEDAARSAVPRLPVAVSSEGEEVRMRKVINVIEEADCDGCASEPRTLRWDEEDGQWWCDECHEDAQWWRWKREQSEELWRSDEV